MKVKFATGLISVLVLAGLFAASASAFPQFWTDISKSTLLRSVSSTPVNQPDAMEFVNNGPVIIEAAPTGVMSGVICTEVEFGTTVVKNNATEEARLALPFGVAEGDNCFIPGTTLSAPVYFDTNAAGAGVAFITVGVGPAFVTTIHNLKLSLNIAGNWCTAQQTSAAAGIKGEMRNWAGPFVEEEPNNLNVQFERAPVAVVCKIGSKTVKYTTTLTGNFYVETMSAATDTAWIE